MLDARQATVANTVCESFKELQTARRRRGRLERIMSHRFTEEVELIKERER